MPRPRKPRICVCPHGAPFSAIFKPAGAPLKDLEVVKLAHDELESMHWCDGEGKSQEEAGSCMGVSRGTVQRLLASARRKVAHALVGQQALATAGEADTSPAVPLQREEPDGDNMMRRESLQ